MNFAVIKTGGKQYKVAEGDILTIEKLPDYETGGKVVFDEVLLVSREGVAKIGEPNLKGVTVDGEFVEEGRHKKLIVLRYKNKINYRKLKGHRQPYSKVKISKINV
ncbi:MAG: 50S ribosomal protein L21 [Candidatus Vogelbacteria bacterium RIFOXYD1_FULL_46_19]|uniref:Large ribosomal subunit protein bL21 n=1 Tax=Candidatus Vogelbacteria bacterium RIFOXYD1_FULL_46_19 TaxID=1802439 RepID=A0A1G2QHM3_9BACT|nr:MAG: 50S ribosomal protein L21 [Candidatus Vogelbacteria bacterium RIFOXYD1_FULL_46_19]